MHVRVFLLDLGVHDALLDGGLDEAIPLVVLVNIRGLGVTLVVHNVPDEVGLGGLDRARLRGRVGMYRGHFRGHGSGSRGGDLGGIVAVG